MPVCSKKFNNFFSLTLLDFTWTDPTRFCLHLPDPDPICIFASDTRRHFVYMQYCLWEMQKQEFISKKPVSQCSAAIIVLLRLTNYTNHTLKTAFGKYLTTNGFCNSSPLFSIIVHSCWPVVKHNFMKIPV